MSNKDLLAGKKGIIMGVANKDSIAWAVAQAAADSGAQLCFTYQSDVLEKRLRPLATSIGMQENLYQCDVSDLSSVDSCFMQIEKEHGKVDFLVHSIAFSDRNELQGLYLDTSKENFLKTMDVSCYSFVAACKRVSQFMNNGGSIITFTYYGSEKVIPNYNVMGVAKAALEASTRYLASNLGEKNIRVNAISAGSIRTLASSGIEGIRTFIEKSKDISPLKRSVTTEDIAGAALFLLSDLSKGTTGATLYVDAGFNIMGLGSVD